MVIFVSRPRVNIQKKYNGIFTLVKHTEFWSINGLIVGTVSLLPCTILVHIKFALYSSKSTKVSLFYILIRAPSQKSPWIALTISNKTLNIISLLLLINKVWMNFDTAAYLIDTMDCNRHSLYPQSVFPCWTVTEATGMHKLSSMATGFAKF
jgi:hypothetical protein